MQYTSIYKNYNILIDTNDQIEIFDKNAIYALYTDSITMELYDDPVCLIKTGNIYSKDSLIKWFVNSNIDPLTEIELKDGSKIWNVAPIVFAMLCFEKPKEDDEKIIFHRPYGNMHNFVKIINDTIDGCIHF